MITRKQTESKEAQEYLVFVKFIKINIFIIKGMSKGSVYFVNT